MKKRSHYTIKVKKRLFWKTYKAVFHSFESTAGQAAIQPWLCIKTLDGSFHYVTGIDHRDWLVYPDYSEFVAQKEKALKKKARPEPKVVESPLSADQLEEMERHALAISAQSAAEAQRH